MNLGALPRTATLTLIVAAGMTAGATAQPADPQQGPYGMGFHRMMGGMGEMPMMGRHSPIMMKIMFAVADTNGDSALSFDEVSAIHKRVFDSADANKDGKLTREEIQAFIRE